MDSKAVGYLEISANVMTTVAILLAGRNSIHTWWTGIVGCLLFCFLFYQSLLYADVVLQMFFIVTSMVGWWGWRWWGWWPLVHVAVCPSVCVCVISPSTARTERNFSGLFFLFDRSMVGIVHLPFWSDAHVPVVSRAV